MLDELILEILKYCIPTISLFLTSKQFRRLSLYHFEPSTDAIMIACKTNNLVMLNRLIRDSRVDLNIDSNSALMTCVEKNYINMTMKLLSLKSVKSSLSSFEVIILIYCNNDHDVMLRTILSKHKISSWTILRRITNILDNKYSHQYKYLKILSDYVYDNVGSSYCSEDLYNVLSKDNNVNY
jgi:hypothetical protein